MKSILKCDLDRFELRLIQLSFFVDLYIFLCIKLDVRVELILISPAIDSLRIDSLV